MTKEEFKKIIAPLGLMEHGDRKDFIRTCLIGNYNNWRKEKQALNLATVGNCTDLEWSLYTQVINLKEHKKKLEFMIENGLSWKDVENDITMPHEL